MNVRMKNGIKSALCATAVTLVGFPTNTLATSVSPVVQGLGGAGRSGVAKESAFTNPASAGLLTDASFFAFYQKPGVADFNAGGRGWSVGASDGGTDIKGSFAYVRNSRARIGLNNSQVYEDRSEFRFASGFNLGGGITGGLGTRYVSRYTGDDSQKFFQSDLGLLFPLFGGLKGGLTYENIFNQEDELPPTLGGGLQYGVTPGFLLFADAYRLMKGTQKGEKGWALAAQLTLAQDYVLRAGRFQDGYRNLRGWSMGFTWNGPRLSLDYALRMVGDGPKEKDHIIGLNVKL